MQIRNYGPDRGSESKAAEKVFRSRVNETNRLHPTLFAIHTSASSASLVPILRYDHGAGRIMITSLLTSDRRARISQ